MRWVRFDPAPAFAGFGVLTPLGVGVDRPLSRARAGAVTVDPADTCGASPLRFRRMDRYGALGYAAAHLALAAAPLDRPSPGAAAPGAGPEADASWGVMLGSSLACWGSIARHHSDLRRRPATDWSPAVFVRTVANAVNGDISIGRGIGGPAETYVSGRTAGAEAILAAGSALSEGRARWILAGGVEAPDPALPAIRPGAGAPQGGGWRVGDMTEAAALALMGREVRRGARPALRLLAGGRAHDAARRLSLAGMLDDLGPVGVGTVIVANMMEPDLLDRYAGEAGGRPILYLPERFAEMGAAGAAVAVALADRMTSASGVLILARDPEGGAVALAVSR